MKRSINWKQKLREHPLFVKLGEYGRSLNEYAAVLDSISRKLDAIKSRVPAEIRRYLPKNPVEKVIPAWKRNCSIGMHGTFILAWVVGDGPSAYEISTVSLRAIARGRISNELFPVAYMLGCVSDFELVQLSNNRTYAPYIKDLLRVCPNPGRMRNGSDTPGTPRNKPRKK